MYITIKLLNGFHKSLLYKINELPNQENTLKCIAVGSFVSVPLKNKYYSAIIIAIHEKLLYTPSFNIKEIEAKSIKLLDMQYYPFLKKVSAYYCINPMTIIKRMEYFVAQQKNISIQIAPTFESEKTTALDSYDPVLLTNEQNKVYQAHKEPINNNVFFPSLLHGITGSGKTEVYKKLLLHCLSQKKSAIFLVPEVNLALQFESIFKNQMPQETVIFGFHSASNTPTKKALWQAITSETPCIIIGVHLPTLLPLKNLGLIIIDEEHDIGYQEKKHPKIHTKEIALMRAQYYNIPILLGSATPSIGSLYQAKQKKYAFFSLTKRFSGALPTIRIAPLINQKSLQKKESSLQTNKKKSRPYFWLTNELFFAIKDRLESNEQIIIFLNRRGHSFFVQCGSCSFVFNCINCSVSLTPHDESILSCHYCNSSKKEPAQCPECSAKKSKFIKKGIGTQQLVTILKEAFPAARIARADKDSSQKKIKWKQTIQDFYNGDLDILVGTQTITKGYHFPKVTLVGIIWADLNLNTPFYNAQETCLQQLVQVAGRAGRQSTNSLVIVQTMQASPLFNYLSEKNYLQFYQKELENRRMLDYPPFHRWTAIELRNGHEKKLIDDAKKVTLSLKSYINKNNLTLRLLGPSKPLIHKVKQTYSRIIYLKSPTMQSCISLFNSIDKSALTSLIFFTPNPLQ